MLNKDSMRTLVVALVLCLVCSVMVSAVAVGLNDMQARNKLVDQNKNILEAAAIYQEGKNDKSQVPEMFKQFETKLVDLETGKFATATELQKQNIDLISYDPYAAAKDPNTSIELDDDPAGIGNKPQYAKVYLKKDANGETELLVLPIHGYGLWGTIYGFMVLEQDLNTIKGITFYDHKETPGLGARIEEYEWRSQWAGKKVYTDDGEVAIGVAKGEANNAEYVNGISGATLTGRGVNNMVRFWLGKNGYEPFITNLKQGAA